VLYARPKKQVTCRPDYVWLRMFQQGTKEVDMASEMVKSIASAEEVHVRVVTTMVNYEVVINGVGMAGKCNVGSRDITSVNFPTTRSGALNINLHVVAFGRSVRSDQAIDRLDEMGLRAAEIHELLALGESQQELPEGIIIALGSSWESYKGYRVVPCILVSNVRADVFLAGLDSQWHEGRFFAAVSKDFPALQPCGNESPVS
jgi:hypothetical protein